MEAALKGQPFGRQAALKAVLLMTGSTYISFFIGLVISAIVARAVGPDDFGRYSYVVWLSGMLVFISNNGLTTTGIRFVSESLGRGDSQAAGAVHAWLLRWQLASLALVTVVFLLAHKLLLPANWKGASELLVAIVALSAAAKCMYLFDVSVAKGYGKFGVEARSTMSMSAINLVGVVGLYFYGAPMLAYLVLFVAISAGYYAFAFRMRRSLNIVPAAHALDPSLAARMKNHLGWTIVLTIGATFSNKTAETYLLNLFATPAELGFFVIGAALSRGAVELLAAGVNSVLMPLMAHGFGQGGAARVNAILADSVRLYCFGGLLLAGVGFFWADAVVALIYGSDFAAAGNIFRVMVLVAGLTLSQSAFGAVLSTTDKQHIRASVALASVVISTSVALLLVPRFGLTGAVVAYAISACVIYLVLCAGVVKVFSVSLPWRELSRLLLAAAVAAGVAWSQLLLSPSLPVQVWAGVLFALTYLAATVGFKAWRRADLGNLRPLADRYPKSLGRALPALERWADR
jgi:O-antigen/teichoic acid export membrane protein